MILFFQDLQMWAESTQQEVFLNAYYKAKRMLEAGHEVIIDRVDAKTINVSEGKFHGNRTTIKEKRHVIRKKKKKPKLSKGKV